MPTKDNSNLSSLSKAGLYLHIPFCRHRCGYCAFAISTRDHGSIKVQSDYLEGLKKEFLRRSERHPHLNFETLYVGGGTPSRLHPDLISDLGQWLYSQHQLDASESTFEVNPEDVLENTDLSKAIVKGGFNRVSVGVQTLSPKGLKVLERQTRSQDITKALDLLSFPSKNLSLDFILGWPGQTQKDIEQDLEFIRSFKPGHISAYLLNLEPGTRMTLKVEQQKIFLPADDLIGDHWNFFRESLVDLGYENYEISSFALSGHQSQHNISTWRGFPYLGLGSGAVSRVGKTRWTNHGQPQEYLRRINAEKWPVKGAEFTGKDVAWKEALLLGCRHSGGLEVSQLASFFSSPLPESFLSSWRQGIKTGDLKPSSDRISFLPEGWSRFDAWVSDWMLILEELELAT